MGADRRNTLAKNKLNNFKEWLVNNGWTICDHTKNNYSVLRAENKKKYKYPIIIYEKESSSVHYTVELRCLSIVIKFIRESKNKNN